LNEIIVELKMGWWIICHCCNGEGYINKKECL